ncbi:lipid-A-disaccharide synthase [Oleiagrimonas sp. C23AA]|uniref:lipid-A-disaccharide synthase n=1 Tax=Oleiagrimonas sp. C23AA TaxID=2719047 RepID=UPI00141E9EF9|nr:lipid-A-disaccharide synthase [Oleiagrimonas sp. C23AA]NII12342.1 lipid-A-disaccharide synthase [Oleiagrimonas sp. C23AA]
MSVDATATAGPTIALIAGEASGDALGADLISALRARHPGARFVGVGGPRMAEAGFEAWHSIDELSVMGFAEVLSQLPRLLKFRKQLVRRLIGERPALVVGIDAPDFNLGVERRLKAAGLHTVHYVSPSVWAWREKRAEKIAHAADRVLCLFPMEPAIYARHGVDARFVGHPLAERFPLVADRAGARATLDLPPHQPVLTVMPGSRRSEVERLAEPFIGAAQHLLEALPGLRILVPAANSACRAVLQPLIDRTGRPSAFTVLDGQSHTAMLAADVVLLASGTATLEAMLAKRPMVVGYRVSPSTYRFVRALRLIKTRLFALPNILADERLVPELMQDACTAEALAREVHGLFMDSERRGELVTRFEQLHEALRGGLQGSPAEHAAEALDDYLS